MRTRNGHGKNGPAGRRQVDDVEQQYHEHGQAPSLAPTSAGSGIVERAPSSHSNWDARNIQPLVDPKHLTAVL
jgi:hypothetical protein